MNINIIVAICKNNGIGINNTLPWRVKSDMIKFKNLTIGNNKNAIIMGKNTWLSLPKKPLPNRDNIILSRSEKWIGHGFKTYNSIEEIKNNKTDDEEVWIIGGEKIYNLLLEDEDLCEIHISRIKDVYECDTFFPKLPERYKLIDQGYLDDDIILEVWGK